MKGDFVNITKKLMLILLLFFMIALNYLLFFQQRSTDATQLLLEPNKLDYNQLLVSFLPLSIGEATLIQFPNEEFFLVDTGSGESSRQLINFLLKYGVQRVSGIILTNFSEEHIGGLADILQQIPVDTIFVPTLTARSYRIADFPEIEVKTLTAGEQLYIYPNVKVSVLAPREPLYLSPGANSLVFQLTHNKINFLFTSDINEEVERKLMEQYALDSEILKVSDFGSNSATMPEFLREVDPQTAIIFSNDEKYYKLSDDVLERLSESWTDVYILRNLGEVKIISDGTNYDVEVSSVEE